jgi:DNA-binding SARP family transcriptional activator
MDEPQTPAKVNLEAGLQISLLGRFTIQQGDEIFGSERFRLRKACNMIKLLALVPRHRLQRDQILEWLWPDHTPEASNNSLYQALRCARQVLDHLTPPGTIRIEVDLLCLYSNPPLRVDVEAFVATAEQARQSQDVTLYQSALTLYTGELLPENRYDEWTISRREALEQIYLNLLMSLARLYQTQGDHQSAIPVYQCLIAADPMQEEAHVSLMYSFALSGHRSHALRQYQLLQDILAKNLAIEPDPETKRLHQLILAGQYELLKSSFKAFQV